MDDRAWIATRKGLFELQRTGLAWRIARVSFLGEPVTMMLPTPSFAVTVRLSVDVVASMVSPTVALIERPRLPVGRRSA